MPSGGPTIAKAYVAIIPTTKDAQKNIAKTLIPDLSSAGEAGGTAMSGGISGALKANAGKIATLAKVALAGVGIAAVKKFTEDVVGTFSEWEQLTGGVEKIFDELDMSAITQDARDAYKTLGLSATQYMEAMTDVGATFASTLGDAKGYSVAKEGMQAIADYASGTGRNVDMLTEKYTLITRAASSYQSIADQFSGILPATGDAFVQQAYAAGYLSEQYEKVSDIPLPEYQEALTHMLTDGVDALGLLGNTAREADTTLAGATSQMSASWSNLLVAFGEGSASDINSAFSRVLDSAGTLAGLVKDRLVIIFQGLVSAVPGMAAQMMEKFRASIEGTPLAPIWDSIAQGFQTLIDTISTMDMTPLTSVIASAQTAGEQLLGVLGEVGGIIMDVIMNLLWPVLQEIWGFIEDHIVPGVLYLWDIMQPGLSLALDYLGQVYEWIGQIISSLVDFLNPAIKILFDILAPIFDAVISALGQIFSTVISVLGQIWSKLKPFIDRIVKDVSGFFSALGQWLNAVMPVVSRVATAIGQAVAQLVQWASSMVTQLIRGIGNIISGVIGIVTGIMSVIHDIVTGNFNALVRDFWNLVGSIGQVIWGIVEVITSPFAEAFRQIKRLWNNTIGRMSFTVPSWVPGIGGSSFSMPQLANGGTLTSAGTVMVGEAGPEILTLPRGARVTPLSSADATTGGTTYSVQVGNVDLSDDDQVRRVTRDYLEFLARMATPGGVSA